MTPLQIFIGWDPREADGYAVTRASIYRHLSMRCVPVRGIVLNDLRRRGLYTRATERRDGQLRDVISDAPMSTEFAISRFLVPQLAGREGWALFMDCDMLARSNPLRILDEADPSKAVMVVKHDHEPDETVKMDNQVQTSYARKNWSSVMLFNLEHPAVRALTTERVNTMRGLDLHQFTWLGDDQIGALGAKWNYLVGYTKSVENPKIVHYTSGIPTMPGYENCEYADEWRQELERWAL